MSKINIKQISGKSPNDGSIVISDGTTNAWSSERQSAVLLPKGTSANRPISVIDGHIRYNTDLNSFEFYENSNWRSFTDHDFPIIGSSLTTGLAFGGVISINGVDNTTFDISAGNGWIVNSYTDPNNPVYTEVSWPEYTGITPTGLTTQEVTYIFINTNGGIHQQISYPTVKDARDYIFLGVVVHSNLTNINVVNNLPKVALDQGAQMFGLTESLGVFNIYGNRITANGTNLSINKTAGEIFKRGSNYQLDRSSPDRLLLGSLSPVTFRYRLQNSTEYTDTVSIDPDNYDLNGVLTPVPNNDVTIQHIYLFPSNSIRIQYGQAVYSSLATAIAAIPYENFIKEQNIADNGLLIGLLVIKEGATNLTDTTTAIFVNAGKFGETSSSGSQIVGTLQGVYDNSTTPEIVVDSTRGALTITDNATPIAASLFEVLSNNQLVNYFSVSATSTIISGLSYPVSDSAARDVIVTDGNGTLSLSTLNIDDLGDVDTTTITPSIGDTLMWNGTQWEPATPLDAFQRAVVSSSTYTILDTDTFIGVQYTTTGAVTLTLPLGSSISNGRIISIKDEGGLASINNITVNRSSTDTIDGDNSLIIAIDHGAIQLMWTGYEWSII